MKKVVLACLAICLLTSQRVVSQNWAWMKGGTATNQTGAYGAIGVPGANNTPGSRSGQAFWKDQAGMFWIYGGEGIDGLSNNGYLNDLWRFDPSTQQWTFMKGDNIIGQTSVFGTVGSPASANKPSSRSNAAYWVDANGNFWMFGGYGFDGSSGLGYLNDMWRYEPSTNNWTWFKGSVTVNAAAVYGTLAVTNSSNNPGGRKGAMTWTAGNGDLYLFGGYGIGGNSSFGTMDDLWKFNINTLSWTWVGGSNSIDNFGTYGTLNTPAGANWPGSRAYGATWKDLTGNFWMFGGDGYDAGTPSKSYLSDMWMFDMTTGQWTWKSGANTIAQPGSYGTQGVASTTNAPGCRISPATWIDFLGNMWLFGGEGLGTATLSIGQLNDLWKYNYTSSQWMWVGGASLVNFSGVYGSQGISAPSNRPGARSVSSHWIDGNNNLWLFGGSGYGSGTATGKLNDVWRSTNCYITPITLTITAKDTSICAGESTSLTATGGNNYLWSSNSATINNIAISPQQTTTYTVSTQDAKGCVYSASFTEFVDPCQNLLAAEKEDGFIAYPQPFADKLQFRFGVSLHQAQLNIRDLSGRIIYSGTLTESPGEIHLQTARGIYIYELSIQNKTVKTGKLIKD